MEKMSFTSIYCMHCIRVKLVAMQTDDICVAVMVLATVTSTAIIIIILYINNTAATRYLSGQRGFFFLHPFDVHWCTYEDVK